MELNQNDAAFFLLPLLLWLPSVCENLVSTVAAVSRKTPVSVSLLDSNSADH